VSGRRAARRAGAKPVRPASPAAPAAAPPARRPPAAWFADPWTWLTLLAAVPLAVRMAGAPWGEPVAEDFDFLHRALLEGMGTLLDGGGSSAFWRPIPHQLYYATFGRVILATPALVTILHLVCLATAALFVQRALRPSWGGPMACAAATFPLLAESVRTLASWPTQFVDVGLALASALAVHAAAQRRTWLALTGLGLALLCKEVAVVTGVLLPFVPGAARDRRERLRLGAGTAAVLAAWGAATLLVRRAAGLELPDRIARSPEALGTPWLAKFLWALEGNARAALSLPRIPSPEEPVLAWFVAALAILAGVVYATDRKARTRFGRMAPWGAWGLAWFVLATAALTPIFPSWQPNRSHHAAMGLGLTTTAALAAAHPSLVAILAGGRLVQLARAPSAPTRISEKPPDAGAFMDYVRLTRLQRFMRAARGALAREYPTLPSGSIVVQHNLPHGLEYALGGDRALQCWYRDSTLRWMRFDDFRAHRETPVTVILSASAGHVPPVGLVHPDAMRGLFLALEDMREHRYTDVLALLDRVDSLQRDTTAVMFRMRSQGLRGYALIATGRAAEAESVAARLVAVDRRDVLVRQVLCQALSELGRLDEAYAQLDTLRARAPRDSTTLLLEQQLDDLKARQARANRER